ncbi:class I SAM-dependent methyltransferase [Peribacillus tepidiphilus]|uniref:class I SAM-dependent methyltransferase n=1 Tax=Peribacillus tepidiphilus TaxID=2652445 RepID=UPI0035B53F7E
MEKFSQIEQLFHVLDDTAKALQEELDCSYLEALAETGENLFHGRIIQEELSEITKKRLNKEYQNIVLSKYSREELRKAFQLAILKGMKENIQPNHQMTPDTIGMFVSYLVEKFMEGKQSFSLLDPAVGTGNLLFTILNQLKGKKIQAYGVDIDDILIKLAYVGANLQEHSVELFNQDSLQPLFVDPVDMVISDIPVGYYPNDARAADYEMKADSGHTYAHHLFIEQSLRHLSPGGYGFFLVPNNLFESEQSQILHKFIKKHCIIQGVIQLPISIFKNEKAAKSIFIIQKKGTETTPPKNVLLVQLPKFSDQAGMSNILQKIDQWFVDEKSK